MRMPVSPAARVVILRACEFFARISTDVAL
jgi:hypothetical protein